jgi:hypothetical protein
MAAVQALREPVAVSAGPRFEVLCVWRDGVKRYAVCDRAQSGLVLEVFDQAQDATIHCALLGLEHLRDERAQSRRMPATLLSLAVKRKGNGKE